jgi:hypothetical protein
MQYYSPPLVVHKGLPIVTISSIGSVQSQIVNGLIAPKHLHRKNELGESTSVATLYLAGSSPTNPKPLASVIAMTLAQRELSPTYTASATAPTDTSSSSPGTSTTSSSSGSASKASQTFAQLLASAQVSPDTDAASTSVTASNAKAAPADSYSAAATNNILPVQGNGSQQAQQYSGIASSGMASTILNVAQTLSVGSSSIPIGLDSFLQTLPGNLAESGVSGLRGLFVNTVA